MKPSLGGSGRNTFRKLEEVFTVAGRIARGEMKHQRVNGRMVKVTLAERRIWLRIAGQAAEAMKSLAENLTRRRSEPDLTTLRGC